MFDFSGQNIWGMGGISPELIVNGTNYVRDDVVKKKVEQGRQEVLKLVKSGKSPKEILEAFDASTETRTPEGA